MKTWIELIAAFIIGALMLATCSAIMEDYQNRKGVDEILKTPAPVQFSLITQQEVLYTTSCGDVIKTGLIERSTGLYRVWWTERKDGSLIEFKVEL